VQNDVKGDGKSDVKGDVKGDVQRDEALKALLASARTVAVVGIKDREQEDAFRIPQYLQKAGYRIVPVNPKLASVLGEPCRASLSQVVDAIDIVNLFRASEHVPAHVDEILAMKPRPKAVWMQLGIHHGPSAQRLRDAGIEVVQDRCMMVDHRRLLGARSAP
jgi:predicted CoA-binding protein